MYWKEQTGDDTPIDMSAKGERRAGRDEKVRDGKDGNLKETMFVNQECVSVDHLYSTGNPVKV